VSMEDYQIIGENTPKIEAKLKATGRAQFLADLELPQMLYGKVLRSPIAHGKILHIDTSKARKLVGVKAVITGKDILGIPIGFSPDTANKYPLEKEKVRFIGDEVAAVAAIDEDVAEEAVELISVEYEELPAIFDPEEAMQPNAIQIHEGTKQNLAGTVHREFGNIKEGFKKSEFIFDDKFETSGVAHCCLETRGALALFDYNGKLTLWSTTQLPHILQDMLSRALGMPHGKIRVIKTHLGGGFGARMPMDPIDAISAILSKNACKPVKILNTREEEFVSNRLRYPMVIHLKTGVGKDGTFLVRRAKIVTDNGAYYNQGVSITASAIGKLIGLYRVNNAKVDGYVVYTNKSWGSAFRGYGGPQVHFAVESQIDMIAEKMGIDTMDIRIRNANQPGDRTIHGWKITSCGFEECINKASELAGWKEKRRKSKNRGVGMASVIHTGGGSKQSGYNFSSVYLKMKNDGTIDVFTGSADIGQGSDTVLAQIAAEVLGLSIDDVNIISSDTDVTPPDLGARATRQTFMTGMAVKIAAEEVKRRILAKASKILELDAKDLDIKDKEICVKNHPEKSIELSKITSTYLDESPIMVTETYIDQLSTKSDTYGYGNFGPAYIFGCQVVEVEVDLETGYVKPINVAAAHDLGKTINPACAEGQIEGGVVQGIGFALTEKILWEGGKIINGNFLGYRIPTSLDVPPIKTILVESNDPNGPFGAKGLGEAPIVPTAAAIANAICDAVGVRIRTLPITPEKILEGIAKIKEREDGKKGNSY
jgi:4-hydroxybenzoyl-CoA reductase alpha subunit